MPKIKTVKGVRDRVKVTGTGRLIGYRAGKRHLLGAKRSKIKRQLRGPRLLSRVDERSVRALIPYA